MGEYECTKIGTLAGFGNDYGLELISGLAGDKDVLETCDVVAIYGENMLSDTAIIALFRGPNGQARPLDDISKKFLPFYQAYPKVAYFVKISEDVGAEVKAGSRERGDFFPTLFERYYSNVTSLHKKFDVPFLKEEEFLFFGILHDPNKVSSGDFLNILMWTCGSENFPSPFFETFMNELTQVKNQEGLSVFLGGCYAVITPEHRAIFDKYYIFEDKKKPVSPPPAPPEPKPAPKEEPARPAQPTSPAAPAKPSLSTPLVPVVALVQEAKKNKVTLVFIWSSYCPLCEKAIPVIKEIEQKLKKVGGGILGIHSDGDNTDRINRIRNTNGATWKDLGLDGSELDILVPENSAPVFLILDSEGRVLHRYLGWNRNTTKSDIESYLKEVVPNYGKTE